jgi:hypothetical protein
MLKVLWVAEGNTGDEAQYEGLTVWDNITINPAGKFRWKPFIDTMGFTLRDLKAKMIVASEDDNMGAPIEKIGTWAPDTDGALCRILTARERYQGEWSTKIGKYLDYEAPDDEPEEPEEEELDEDLEEGEEAEEEPEDEEPEDEETEEEPAPAKPARRSTRTAAKPAPPAAADKPARTATRTTRTTRTAAEPASATPAKSSARGTRAARTATAAKPAAKPTRGRRATAQSVPDDEPPF